MPARIDYVGIATLVSAIGAAVAAIIGAIKTNRKAAKIVAATDGINTELRRQNVELKKAVADPSSVANQTAGEAGGASVGIDKGVVTVEAKERDKTLRERSDD